MKYGYVYTNMFGDRILTGIFNTKKEAERYKFLREMSNLKSADPIKTKDNNTRIIQWTKQNIKKYNYIYSLQPDGSKRVIKEFDEHGDFIPDNWEMM